MTAQPPSRTGPPGYQTPEPQVVDREDFTPRGPAVVGAFATLTLGLSAILTGSGAVLSVFIAVNVLLLTAAPYGKSHPADRAPACGAVSTGPAW